MKNKCSLCRKDIHKTHGHTELDKPLCEFCVVRYEVLKAFPDFRESEEFGIEIGNGDVRSINYKLLDVICYQHFRRRFDYHKRSFSGPLTILWQLGFFSVLLGAIYIGMGANEMLSVLLGFVTLVGIYLIKKIIAFRRFQKFQGEFTSKLSMSHNNGELKGSIALAGNQDGTKLTN